MEKVRILVIDDEQAMREVIKDIVVSNLRKTFKELVVDDASTGMDAINMLKDNNYDVVLCDWRLTDMTGGKILEWVKGEEKLSKVPFVMITAYTDKEIVTQVVKLGAADFLVKPFNAETLIAKIIKALKITVLQN